MKHLYGTIIIVFLVERVFQKVQNNIYRLSIKRVMMKHVFSNTIKVSLSLPLPLVLCKGGGDLQILFKVIMDKHRCTKYLSLEKEDDLSADHPTTQTSKPTNSWERQLTQLNYQQFLHRMGTGNVLRTKVFQPRNKINLNGHCD